MKKQIKYILTGALVLFVLSSCKKEYDTPPVNTIPEGKKIQSINTLKKMFGLSSKKITEDYSVYGVVTIDENNGNLYKNVFIQDNPKDVTNPDSIRGVNLRLLSSGGLYQGDYIRINLKNCVLSTYNGVKQIDSVDVDKNITKIETSVVITPAEITIDQAIANVDRYSGTLVKFNNVEFSYNDAINNTTYANAVAQTTQNRTLYDCNLRTLDVRTSGYSNFANTVVPKNNGSIIGVLSQFGSGLQLYLRTPSEAIMNNVRCDGTTIGVQLCNPVSNLNEPFTSHTNGGTVSAFCWSTMSSSGTPQWTIGDIAGNKNAVASLSGTSNSGSQSMWMVSPEISYASTNTLSFKSAVLNYNHNGLEVYVLRNYSGDPNAATKTLISSAILAGASSGNNVFVGSGIIPLNTFGISGIYRIGFKYTGNPSASPSQTTTFKIDDVIIAQ
jgi:hypothetical protein